tara:strand:- start:44457 stop:44699 length:243 start_codon:yes stop_codon:yes gene_type:complete
MSVNNSRKAWDRNGFLGRLKAAQYTLHRLEQEAKTLSIPSEFIGIRTALSNLEEINNLPVMERHRIFGKINRFKKYEKNI